MKAFRYLLGILVCFVFMSPIQASYKIKDGQIILQTLDGYHQCLRLDRGGTFCLDGMNRFLKDNPNLSWQGAQAIRKTMNSYVAVPFFYRARNHKSFNCSDGQLAIALKSAFGLPKNEANLIGQASELAFDVCKDNIPKVMSEVTISDKEMFKKYCSRFLENNFLKGVKKKKCIRLNKKGEK